MDARELIRMVEAVGGALWASGESLDYRLPESARPLVEALRARKWELLELLSERPPLPAGLRLLRWQPVTVPVRVNGWLTVTDADKFIGHTLRQIEARLSGKGWRAGNWTLSELIERLEAVGVGVALVRDSERLQ